MLVLKQTINSKSVTRMKRQQGFTLMEVMLAAFVLSVGMLGSTAMVLRGMEQADQTNAEGLAAQSAINMAERLRSNIRAQGKSGSFYDNLVADPNSTVTECLNTCSPADVALYHAYIWGIELEESLSKLNPKGYVEALSPNTNDAVFKITVEWDGFTRTSTTSANLTTNSYVMIFQP